MRSCKEKSGIPSVAVKCVDIRRNTSGEGGLLDGKNPRCITSVEDVDQIFTLCDEKAHRYRCIYCEQEYKK